MNEPAEELDATPQLVIVARLAEFCQFRSASLQESDPWDFMLRKLREIEEPLGALKTSLFNSNRKRLLAEAGAGALGAERCAEYRGLFEGLVSPGDFVDIAFHLAPGAPNQAEALAAALAQARPATLFDKERTEPGQRSPSWEKLVGELHRRLDLDLLGRIMVRKPATAPRRAMVLRRLRSNVAEYCTVVRIPMTPQDTFTPFMLPRIEALVAACLRFLKRYR
ncbi:MAG: hypothetical protein PHF00_12040 [Elusimicrobia bacterium]|nr:hypothetical protein [Elusimicrobiota bacterium]